jgi:hypothetical protein
VHTHPGRPPRRPLAAMLVAGLLVAGGATAARPSGQAAPPPGQTGARPVNQDARIMADFVARVQEYAALHEKLEATLPPLARDSTPEAIDSHQRDLAQLIGRARSSARPGDIFSSEARALFRRHIAGVLATPDGPEIRAAILDEDPGRIRLTVNGRYPDTVPLSTVPTDLLAVLPRLPEQLEYHFISRQLLLFDVHARIIVDLIDNALPR